MSADAKRGLRREMRAALAAMSVEARAAESAQVVARLREMWPPGVEMRVLATYPMAEEVDLREYLSAVVGVGGGVVLPKVETALAASMGGTPMPPSMSLWLVPSLAAVVPGYRGVPEPDVARCESVSLDSGTLVLAPGLAFDAEGHRLGRGKGFFDRVLSTLAGRVPIVAPCFRCQFVESVPTEPHDIAVDWVVLPDRSPLHVRSRRG